jgi:hypothetical protein
VLTGYLKVRLESERGRELKRDRVRMEGGTEGRKLMSMPSLSSILPSFPFTSLPLHLPSPSPPFPFTSLPLHLPSPSPPFPFTSLPLHLPSTLPPPSSMRPH